MRVARQVRQHLLRTGEGALGIDGRQSQVHPRSLLVDHPAERSDC